MSVGKNREALWNNAEVAEVHKDAYLAREIVFAIPLELNEAQGIHL
ncbi:MobA/MobL family protein [uncultured Novosphingobium sp.]